MFYLCFTCVRWAWRTVIQERSWSLTFPAGWANLEGTSGRNSLWSKWGRAFNKVNLWNDKSRKLNRLWLLKDWNIRLRLMGGWFGFSVLPYQVQVFTSDEEMDSGTESHVFITLYGRDSDTGRRHLHLNNRKSFQTGQVRTHSQTTSRNTLTGHINGQVRMCLLTTFNGQVRTQSLTTFTRISQNQQGLLLYWTCQ